MTKGDIVGWSALLGALLLLAAAAVPIYQAIVWLKTSEWQPITVHVGLSTLGINLVKPAYSIQWLGIQKICLWFLSMSLAVGLVLLSILCVFCASLMSEILGDKK